MKKRISLITLLLVLVLAFTGCGNKEISYDENALENTAKTFISSFAQMPDESFDQYKDASGLELDLTLLQSGLPIESDNFIKLIDTWRAATDEYGELVSCDYQNGTFKVKNGKIELLMPAEFSGRSASILMVYDEEGNVESMAVNGDYALSEILTKAGMNTLIGMGTVFCVLIFIAFIIYLLGFIPKFLANKKEAEKPAPAPAPAPAAAAPAVVEEEDDSELIAVISAAIAAGEGTSVDGFRVRSIKRRKSNKWN